MAYPTRPVNNRTQDSRDFDEMFARLVLPDLKRNAQALAQCIAIGACSFSQAEAILVHEAWRRGAYRLTNYDDFLEALACELLELASQAAP